MRASDDTTTPATSLLRRLVPPWEYRHIHAVAGVRLAGGGFQVGIGAVLLSLGRKAGTDQERRTCFRWAAWFLGMGALQLVGGCIDLAVASSAPPRT